MKSHVLVSLAFAALVVAAGCAHHDDPPASIAAADAGAVAALQPTGFDAATASVFAAAKLPVYPKAEFFDNSTDTMTPHVTYSKAEFTSPDPTNAVDAWYKAHLDASFKRKIGVGMTNSTVYDSGSIASGDHTAPKHEVSLVKVKDFPGKGTVTDIILLTVK
jgi:PBP1b-binding outer membrane lipoprotein LpoB